MIRLTAALFILAAAMPVSSAKIAEDQRELSIYFGIKPGVGDRDPSQIDDNAFAIVELENHVVNTADFPEAEFRDPERVQPYFPDGYVIEETFFDAAGQPVDSLERPGMYGVELTVKTPDRDYSWERVLYRLPDGASLPGDRSEVMAAKLKAANELGRPWREGDAYPYSYAIDWLWDASRAAGKQAAPEWFAIKPSDYDERVARGEKLPAFIYLHGSGARGFTLDQLKADKFYDSVRPHAEMGLIFIVPHSPGQWFHAPIEEVIAEATAELAIDPDRIVMGGHSMGGSGSWRVARARPGWFAGIVPVAGGNVPPPSEAGRYVNLPAWAAFGENDNAPAHQRTQALVDAINAAGGEAQFEIIPGANHMQGRNWFFADPKVYEWAVQQTREN